MKTELTKREAQLKIAKKVTWTLVDDSHERFDRWRSSVGYIESFSKGMDPNVINPYGLSCPLTDEEINMRLGITDEEKDVDDKNKGKWGGCKVGCHEPWNKGKSVNDILDADTQSRVLRG